MESDDRDVRRIFDPAELARFNQERANVLGGRPVRPGERLPLPPSGVGGDVMDDE